MYTRMILAFSAVLLSGCSYFKSSERLDLAPFAERTVSLAADIEYSVITRGNVHYLREYKTDEMVLAHGQKWDQIRTLLRGVAAST